MDTPEAHHLRRWCVELSWSFCPKCGKLPPVKLVPSFRTRKPNALDLSCKCGWSPDSVPQAEDVPLILRNLSAQDIRVLHPLDTLASTRGWSTVIGNIPAHFECPGCPCQLKTKLQRWMSRHGVLNFKGCSTFSWLRRTANIRGLSSCSHVAFENPLHTRYSPPQSSKAWSAPCGPACTTPDHSARTDKMTRQFPPHPDQEKENVVYQLYLRREPAEENMSLLQWLRSHTLKC